MHQLVGPAAAGQHIRIVFALAFHKHFDGLAEHPVIADPALFLNQIIQALQAFTFHL
ncbi:hypothetical protein D3C87_1785240 [compost metagenome]